MSVSKTYFERSALTVFIISSFGSLLNMGFQYISLKALSVAEFGDLNTLLSMSTVVSTIATVASLDAVRVTSSFWADNSREKKERKESVFQYITGVVPIFLVAVTILFILSYLLRDSLNQFFNISDNRLIPLAVISGGINIFSATLAGILQGMQRYVAASTANNIIFVLKLVLSVVLYNFGYGVVSALIALLTGNLLSCLLSLFLIGKAIAGRKKELSSFSRRQYVESFGGLFAIQLALSLISNIDMQVVNSYFDNNVSGLYSSAMVIGRISNYVISSLIFVFFPVAAADAKSQETKRTFAKTMLYTIVITASFALISTKLYHFLAVPVLGSAYASSEIYIFPIALLFVPVSLISVIATYSIARKETQFVSVVLFTGIIVFLIAVGYLHSSVRQVLFLETGILSLACMLVVVKERLLSNINGKEAD